jgi:hypothetical protein
MTSAPGQEPVLTVRVCEIPGHEGHFAEITVGYLGNSASFCLTRLAAAFLSQALAPAVSSVTSTASEQRRPAAPHATEGNGNAR